MTLAELMASPNGTTDIEVKGNRYALGPSTAFKATHREKITGGAMRPKMFFGATADEARAKAEEYDRKRKETLQRCKDSANRRRQTSGK